MHGNFYWKASKWNIKREREKEGGREGKKKREEGEMWEAQREERSKEGKEK